MFEASIMPAVANEGGVLRPLDWGELSARFAAARDLRALVTLRSPSGGSFAERVDSVFHCASEGEPRINFPALEGVKPLAAINPATVNDVAEGDQGTQ